MSIIYKRLNFNIQEIIDKKLLIRNTKGQAEQIENDLFKYVLYEELDKHLIKKEHTNKFLKWFCFEVINKVINNNMYSLKDMKLKTIKNQVLNLKKCYYNNNNSSSCYIIEDIIEKIEFLIREFISSNISIKLFQDNIDIDKFVKNESLRIQLTLVFQSFYPDLVFPHALS